ncbi:MAG: preprotein translocase subunit SecA [Planctomycetota bacterium]
MRFSLFPSRNERQLRKSFKRAELVLGLEREIGSLSDADLKARFQVLRQKAIAAQGSAKEMDVLLPESFAITREVCDRRLGIWQIFNPKHGFNFQGAAPAILEAVDTIRQAVQDGRGPHEVHLKAEFYAEIRGLYPESKPPFRMQSFPVQLVGGMVLHEGKIAEMKTGEGKTLTAVNAVVLNALAGQVFVVTVNDYLAGRDAAWMAPAYLFLGLTCGSLKSQMPQEFRKAVYSCDIVYGTNSEFGFDYLRDNMASKIEDQVQKRRRYAIVDEVDSVLIDEARTPLIISGRPDRNQTPYMKAHEVTAYLEQGRHFTLEEKHHSASLTEEGVAKCEELLEIQNMYHGRNMEWPHLVENAIRARHLYKLDKDYVVDVDPESGRQEVIIVDEFTGRMQYGRRWSDGLHQAIEAKEGLQTREETVTLATITIQNYFRMFEKLAGMTGTAWTEAQEFHSIYGLDTMVIPTHRKMVRMDHPDVIYGTYESKMRAITREIEEYHGRGQPVLVGTVSVSKSEDLSARLRRKGIPHEVLNAKHHAREAEIIAKAGARGAVTIATNMAGRGTDIVLGQGVQELGGLHVLGTERHESRRIDNQLRGRAGRQGDPGSSRFFLSLEDDLIRIFAGEWMRTMMQKGLPEDEALESRLVSRSIARAQKRVEEHNFGIRKNLIEYDDVKNEQRRLVYEERQAILENRDIRRQALAVVGDALDSIAADCLGQDVRPVDRDGTALASWCKANLGFEPDSRTWQDSARAVGECLAEFEKRYVELEAKVGKEQMDLQVSYLLLYKLDNKWKEHLQEMDKLRSAIGMRGYAQIDPKIAYQKEGYELFDEMLVSYAQEVASLILKVEISEEEAQRDLEQLNKIAALIHEAAPAGPVATPQPAEPKTLTAEAKGVTAVREAPKVGRNEPCPCGSGKKFKNCHGGAQA